MTQITDREVYQALGIGEHTTPFSNFFYTGILRLKNLENLDLPAKPIYIVELSGGKTKDSMVAVYDAKPEVDNSGQPVLDENGNWIAYKNYYETVEDKQPKYSDKTLIGRLAETFVGAVNKSKNTKHRVRVYYKPLYITELIPGINTFTRKEGLGFKDYETELIENVRYKTNPTGVFIGLDSIKDWSAPKVRPEDVLEHIREDEARETKNPFFISEW